MILVILDFKPNQIHPLVLTPPNLNRKEDGEEGLFICCIKQLYRILLSVS